jgi:DNA-binding XRE family transcriptional regulator
MTGTRRNRKPNRKLIELRMNAGLSPAQLGARAGISGKQMRLIETGRAHPQARTQFAIADVFDLLPLDLWPLDRQRVMA